MDYRIGTLNIELRFDEGEHCVDQASIILEGTQDDVITYSAMEIE